VYVEVLHRLQVYREIWDGEEPGTFFFFCIDSYLYVLGHEYFCTTQFNSATRLFSQKMKEDLKA